jgi:hypothetical protein
MSYQPDSANRTDPLSARNLVSVSVGTSHAIATDMTKADILRAETFLSSFDNVAAAMLALTAACRAWDMPKTGAAIDSALDAVCEAEQEETPEA